MIGNTIEIFTRMWVSGRIIARKDRPFPAAFETGISVPKAFCVWPGSIDRSNLRLVYIFDTMRLDFNISPILPTCGNATKRSNAKAWTREQARKKKEKEREREREREDAKKWKDVKEPSEVCAQIFIFWKIDGWSVISTNDRSFRTPNFAKWLAPLVNCKLSLNDIGYLPLLTSRMRPRCAIHDTWKIVFNRERLTGRGESAL